MYSNEKRSSRNTRGFSDLCLRQLKCLPRAVPRSGHLRRCHAIEHHQHHSQPEYSIHDLDRKLHRGKQQWKQAHVTGNGQRSERSEVPSVFECEQAKGYNDKQNRFLVDVPAEEEGSVSAQCESRHKCMPIRFKEELNECRLQSVRDSCHCHWTEYETYNLRCQGQDECHARCYIW